MHYRFWDYGDQRGPAWKQRELFAKILTKSGNQRRVEEELKNDEVPIFRTSTAPSVDLEIKKPGKEVRRCRVTTYP